jgi:hypothetical protein
LQVNPQLVPLQVLRASATVGQGMHEVPHVIVERLSAHVAPQA